jgi:ribose transport system substrate-binding protein
MSTTTDVSATDASATPTTPRSRGRRQFSAGFLTAVVLVLLIGAAGAWNAGFLRPRPTVALVTNGSDAFWDPVIQGAQDAAAQRNLKLKIVRGTGDQAQQSQAVRELIDHDGIKGLGISPIDADKQSAVLREVAMRMPLVAVDSDCPESGRQWYVGTDNYGSGRQIGDAVREAAPDGGEILISVGSVDTLNGKLRRQGVIDELLDRRYSQSPAIDALDAPLKGSKYTIVATCVDNYDRDRATQLAAEQIKAHPDLKCVVALYSYSAPAVLKALEQAGRLGKVQVIGFDALPETLAAVEAGNVFATMQQAQYDFGFDTVRALADALEGDPRTVAASTPMRYLALRVVTKDNVAEVKQEIEKTPKPTMASAAK